jgi:hypothetical protein
MKHAGIVLVAAALLLCTRPALAIDRDAKMIDAIAFQAGSFQDGGLMEGTLWAENATANKNFALLFGGGIGTVEPDEGDSFSLWEVGLGLKYYVTPLTGLSLIGTYTDLDIEENDQMLTGMVLLKQRFVPAARPLSPFLKVSAAIRSDKPFPHSDDADTSSDLLGKLALGCDFSMTRDFVIVLEGAYEGELDLSGGKSWKNGALGSIAMAYYWD